MYLIASWNVWQRVSLLELTVWYLCLDFLLRHNSHGSNICGYQYLATEVRKVLCAPSSYVSGTGQLLQEFVHNGN